MLRLQLSESPLCIQSALLIYYHTSELGRERGGVPVPHLCIPVAIRKPSAVKQQGTILGHGYICTIPYFQGEDVGNSWPWIKVYSQFWIPGLPQVKVTQNDTFFRKATPISLTESDETREMTDHLAILLVLTIFTPCISKVSLAMASISAYTVHGFEVTPNGTGFHWKPVAYRSETLQTNCRTVRAGKRSSAT